MKRIGRVLLSLILLLFIAFSVLGNNHEPGVYQGKIIQLDNFQKTPQIIQQVLIVKFTNGPYNGKTATITHDFSGYPTELLYSIGNLIFVQEFNNPPQRRFVVTGPVRDHVLYILIAIFALCIIIIAGFQGIRSIISLSLIFMIIFYALVPLVIRGSNPIVVTLVLAAISTIFTIFFVSGVNQKTVAAVIGTISGVVTAGVLAWYFGEITLLTGYSDESIQMLYYTASAVNFKGLLFSGIVIGALGAIMDISVSIASSITEIKQSNPQISYNALVASGFRVGKDAISTMTASGDAAMRSRSDSLVVMAVSLTVSQEKVRALLKYPMSRAL